ncbi:ATP-binding protein [Adlercreutzia sp. R21]|uniref:ATP-binding protein n=1 Tax=Adlercreutzia wanghongyangiae TaxID=3111451 RepID=UPI002DBA8289|nr:ATP-binding protein [Adlercreutzia sp. R21]MEC4184003.1 ATP-binding protein [Adlercreutzia sp. R21]
MTGLAKRILGPRAIIAALSGLAFVVAATCFYYHTVEEQLFDERDAHLTEITMKVADQLRTVMDVGLESASIAGAALAETPLTSEDALIERLAQLEKAADHRGSIFVAFDDDGSYCTAAGMTGRWVAKGAYANAENVTFAIGGLPYDTINTYLFMICRLPAPVPVGDEGRAVTHLAIASNMATIQEMLDVAGFGDECLTYLVTPEGQRIYQHTFGRKFIGTPNVLDTTDTYDFVAGGNAGTLRTAVADQGTECLEFRTAGGQDYFVCATALRDASLMLFVPTDTLSVGEGNFLITTFGYFLVVAVVVVAMAAAIMSFISQARADVALIAQQEEANRRLGEANRALAAARDKAELASRAKTEFLSNMSHDIRTPMNAIIGFTNLAETHLDDRARVQDCLEKISSSSNHLLSLINDILDMSKIEHGKLQLQEEPCDLRAVLRELADMVRDQAQAKGLTLDLDDRGIEHSWVVTDALRLNQVLINIVSNAIKYTKEGGVRITAAEEEGTYRFIVADTGVGMGADYLPEIFDAFTRERNTTLSNIQGTGLGLAITKNLVEMMGGSITVESEPGRGSTFTVTLPLTLAERNDAAAEAAEEEGAADLEGLHILLAEDNELNALIVVGILGDAGIRIDWVDNGQKAVDAMAQAAPGTYDAVLMDAQMPVMGGYDAARAIRDLPDTHAASVPIIALTANAFAEDKQRAFEAGMSAHVAKPINTKELLAVIARLCGTEK